MVSPWGNRGAVLTMRILYLHVGVHRTATTSIQRFMRANFNPLLAKGYLYPFGVARHTAVVGRLRYGMISAADFAQDLLRRMEARGDHVQSAVISDEDMSSVEDFSAFAGLTRYFDVKVVVSLRRQDLWLESWYLQNVKWQWNPSLSHLTFAEFYDRRAEFFWIDYAARLAQYEALFGAGCIRAGVFEEADMPDGPIDAFLRMIGIVDQSGFGEKLHSNSSLSPLASEFMRHLPLDEVETLDRRLFERACMAVDAGLVKNGSKLIMAYDQRLAVQAEYAAGNKVAAQRYLKRDVLFAEPLPDPRAQFANTELPSDTEVMLRDFVAPMVKALGLQLAEARLAAAAQGPDSAAVTPVRGRQGPKKDRDRART
jgi:hypothetical protein